jgi:hypothetical protein
MKFIRERTMADFHRRRSASLHGMADEISRGVEILAARTAEQAPLEVRRLRQSA